MSANRIRSKRARFIGRVVAAALVFALAAVPAWSQSEPPAEISVHGLGWWGSREAARTLRTLGLNQDQPTLDAAAIEDAALILFHELERDGYLHPMIRIALTTPDGAQSEHVLGPELTPPLPRPLAARDVAFHVDRGLRYLIEAVEFEGLTVLEAEDARAFFVGATMLIPLAGDRVYSPGGARQSTSNLEEELRQRGHAGAAVELVDEQVDHATGAVRLRVRVDEGPVWRVRELAAVTPGADTPQPPEELLAGRTGRRWSPVWRQNTLTALRRWYFERGYPDVSVRLTTEDLATVVTGERSVRVQAHIDPGSQVRLGDVRFVGHEHTREETMRRLVTAEPGSLLDPVELDNSQARLARLGVFSRVNLRYVAGDEPGTRDAVFAVREGRRQEVNLLAGYGSYEQLRAGVEWNHFNLWGRAHTHTLQFVQSMKSSSGDYRYTIPDIFGSKINGTARLFGLRREELAFVREEYGANLSLSRPFEAIGATGSLGYAFRRVRNSRNELATRSLDETQANIASIDLRLTRDQRDNPLNPHRGHRVFIQLEVASKVLGGEVDYQQLTLGGSYHTAWGRSRWIHVGLEHGVVTTFGADDDLALPVSVRFFPGGEGSIRGYNRGEAAPRTATGEFVGAKSYLQFNLEIEQALTPKLSLVAFVDALGTAAQMANYPFDDTLVAAGLGVRYHTLIGPLRLEYGHNLNPRARDPSGTVLFSIGFPF